VFFFSQGKLSTYRFCDNVWTLVLKDFVVKDSNQNQHNTAAPTAQIPRADKVKIVACDGKSKLLFFFLSIHIKKIS
jgi:transcription initiation factor TFIIA small subunit